MAQIISSCRVVEREPTAVRGSPNTKLRSPSMGCQTETAWKVGVSSPVFLLRSVIPSTEHQKGRLLLSS